MPKLLEEEKMQKRQKSGKSVDPRAFQKATMYMLPPATAFRVKSIQRAE
jgi:hypothetical protein